MHPGPVRDRLVRFLNDWLGQLETAVRDAQAEGAIDPTEDPGQLAFEIEAALLLANAQFVVGRTRNRSNEPARRSRAGSPRPPPHRRRPEAGHISANGLTLM